MMSLTTTVASATAATATAAGSLSIVGTPALVGAGAGVTVAES